MKNATLRQLRVFASVARHLSFIRAAEELKLSAPAVSMQIKELEIEVGLPLFDRTSRQVSLTMVGENLMASIDGVRGELRDTERSIAATLGEIDDRLSRNREDASNQTLSPPQRPRDAPPENAPPETLRRAPK